MEAIDIWIAPVVRWAATTDLSRFMQQQSTWTYATLETLHLFGMILLLGTVGVFDLRVLGFAKSIPPGALHRLIPWGIAGFVLNVVTGGLFVIGNPAQYAYNPAFRVKLALIALAGLNLLLFYAAAFRGVQETAAGADARLPGRIVTGISLSAWLGVAICGGLVTSGFFG